MRRAPAWFAAAAVAVPAALAVLAAVPASAGENDGEAPAWFYRGRPYGSEALVHPLRLILNGGFGIFQLEGRNNRLAEVDYANGASNVWRNLRHPFAAINQRGWNDFLSREVFPFTASTDRAHYWPNYTQHLIGGGMSYRMMTEWFTWHGYRRPKLHAATTITLYHLLNEVVENNEYVGPTTDPIADLYLFDPLSMVLFSDDRVARFFGERLHMADWSYQPMLDPRGGRLENNGQNFAMKIGLPRTDRMSLFYHFGTHGEFGLSYRVNRDESISAGFGGQAKDLVKWGDGLSSVDLGLAAGIFYDRDNSLMASLLFARTKDYKVRLNLYPGLVRVGRFSPGFVAALNRENSALVGVTFGGSPLPAGLGTSF